MTGLASDHLGTSTPSPHVVQLIDNKQRSSGKYDDLYVICLNTFIRLLKDIRVESHWYVLYEYSD